MILALGLTLRISNGFKARWTALVRPFLEIAYLPNWTSKRPTASGDIAGPMPSDGLARRRCSKALRYRTCAWGSLAGHGVCSIGSKPAAGME